MITKFKKPVAASGATIENEPIIKSDGASSDVMEWQASTGSSKVEIREDASNNLKLEVDGIPVASGLAGIDGQGLHFDGAAGNIDIASPPDLGTKFSFEFIIQADTWADSTWKYLVDFGTGGRFIIGTDNGAGDKLSIYDNVSFKTFGVATLDDLKVHHLCVTVDGTSAILYDNGNQVGSVTISASHAIDSCTDARIGSNHTGGDAFFDGTLYRTRFWSYPLSAQDVTDRYENATVPLVNQDATGGDHVTNGTFATDSDWTKETGWTISGGKAVAASAAAGSNLYQTPAGSAAALVVGKKYRLTYTISDYSAGSIRGRFGLSQVFTTRSANGTYTEDVVCTANTVTQLVFNPLTTFTGKIDDVSVYQIGCAVDMDFSFSNPSQSLLIQDRYNNADGTSSATGVVQVTPIEQLNSKSARIGTTAATPADGELMVGGAVAVKLAAQVNDVRITQLSNSTSNGAITFNDLVASSTMSGIYGKSSSNLTLTTPTAVDLSIADVLVARTSSTGLAVTGEVTTSGALTAANLNASNGSSSFARTHSTTTASLQILDIKATSSGDMADGFGPSIVFSASDTGTTSNQVAEINAVRAGSDTAFNLEFQTADATRLTISSAGLATFANGIAVTTGGIKFPATQSASADANTLDDYEEGTWTPTLPNGGTFYANYARYTRIGQQVTVYYYVATLAPAANASRFQIAGLPFVISDVAAAYPAGTIGYVGDGDWTAVGLIGGRDSAFLYFHDLDGSNIAVTNNEAIAKWSGSVHEMIGQLTYIVK